MNRPAFLDALVGCVGSATSPVASQVSLPVHARLQTKKKVSVGVGVASAAGCQVAPPSVLRKRPTSVVARTTAELRGSTLMSVTVLAVTCAPPTVATSATASDQVAPASVLLVRPGCRTSKGSPKPR